MRGAQYLVSGPTWDVCHHSEAITELDFSHLTVGTVGLLWPHGIHLSTHEVHTHIYIHTQSLYIYIHTQSWLVFCEQSWHVRPSLSLQVCAVSTYVMHCAKQMPLGSCTNTFKCMSSLHCDSPSRIYRA